VALRVGTYAGPFDEHGEVAAPLADLAAALVKEAGQPTELQIDFDCAAGKLDGYRNWVQATQYERGP
jgi:hypothetical protein